MAQTRRHWLAGLRAAGPAVFLNRMKTTSRRLRLIPLRPVLALLALGVGVTHAWAVHYTLPQQVGEVQLKDGTVLSGVTLVSVGESSVTGKWDGGRGVLPLAMFPDAMQADLRASALLKPVTAPAAPGIAPAHSPVSAPGADAPNLPTEIKLNNGFVMYEAKVAGWRLNAMTVDYVGGKVLVKYDDIVPEQRMIFVARKIELIAAYDRAAAARAVTAAGQTRAPAAPGEPTPAELQALVKTGIAAHQLVKTMTRQEVVQAVGMPDGVQYDKTKPEAAYWLYKGKGKKPDGTPGDRILGFEKDILQGWKDQ